MKHSIIDATDVYDYLNKWIAYKIVGLNTANQKTVSVISSVSENYLSEIGIVRLSESQKNALNK